MLSKIKDNLGLIATAIALMGSIGAGLSTAADIVNTLQGIDDRMNQVEVDFEMLKESTFVQNDIAVLYEKIQQLEMAAQNVGRFNEEMAALQTNLMNLEQNYYDLKFAKGILQRISKIRWYSFLKMQKSSAKKINVVVTPSMNSKEDIHIDFQVPMENIHVIPNGIDCDIFYPLPQIQSKKNRY